MAEAAVEKRADVSDYVQAGNGSRRLYSIQYREEVVDELLKHLGPAAPLLADRTLTDIFVNPGEDRVWTIGAKGKIKTDIALGMNASELFVGAVVGFYNDEFSKDFPYFEGVIPFIGSRFTATAAPFTPAGTGWVIRQPTGYVPALDEYLTNGIIETEAMLKRIRKLIVQRKNILIGGEMGSGKTTLLNAALAEAVTLDKGKARWGIIEDCDEIRTTADDHIKLMVNEAVKIDGAPMDWAFAVKRALRLSLSRIIIGEIRSHASVILDAWRVVMRGNFASIHGNDPHEVMARLEFLLRREGYPIDRREIAKTIDAVIVMKKVGAAARRIRDVVEIKGVTPDGEGYIFAAE